jgi:ABC-type glycerol-3-phosphate transport system substrate-binding protein
MNTKNHLLKLLYLLIILAFALSACGGDKEPAADTPSVDAPAADAPATDVPVVKPSGELVIWVQQANQDIWEQTILPEFQAMYPDITLEFVNYAPEEVARQVALAIQGGTGGPDLGVTQYRDLQQLIALQGVLDISDLMASYVDDFSPEILAYCETDGAYYCTPWDIGPTVTYYRRDIFTAAGLSTDPDDVSDLVATWDDYLDLCVTIKDETGLPCFPQNKANNYGNMLIDMMWQQGLGFFNEDGSVAIDAPEVVAILEKIGEFWDAGVTSDNLDWTDPWYAELGADMDNTDTPPPATLVYPAWMGGTMGRGLHARLGGRWRPSFNGRWFSLLHS